MQQAEEIRGSFHAKFQGIWEKFQGSSKKFAALEFFFAALVCKGRAVLMLNCTLRHAIWSYRSEVLKDWNLTIERFVSNYSGRGTDDTDI